MGNAGANPGIMDGVNKDIEEAERLVRELNTQIKLGFKDQKDINKFEKNFDNLNKVLAKTNIQLKDIALDRDAFTFSDKELNDLIKNLKEAQSELEDLKTTAAGAIAGFTTEAMRKEINKAIDDGEDLNKVLEKLGRKQYTEKQKTVARKLALVNQENIDNILFGKYNEAGGIGAGHNLSEEDLNLYQSAIKAIIVQGQDAKEVFDTLKESLSEQGKAFLESDNFIVNFNKDVETLFDTLKKFNNENGFSGDNLNIGGAAKAFKSMNYAGSINANGEFELSGNVENIEKIGATSKNIAEIQNELNQKELNLAAIHEENTKKWIEGLDQVYSDQQKLIEGTNEETNALREQISAQERTEKAFSYIKDTVKNLTSISTIIATITSQIRETSSIIEGLDKAFGQIAMVTDFSIEDMWEKYGAYAKMANELGQTTLSVVQASGLYFQQGLEEKEALELTASTMRLATLAGLDFEQATSLMTSAVRGFDMEMAEGEHVTDVYSELAAHAAASVDGIANAMSRTAAIAHSAGMEFETTSAMLTTMIQATQESPETLGTAMKTVIARFTELKNNVSATESEFEDLDYNKVDKALKSIGVALKDTNGQFRDIDDVFLDVAEKWDTLDRNTQRYVATTAAGSRQQSRFIALMENYKDTIDLINIAQNSAGRSSEQFAKYQDTLENKVKRLKNSWEQLRLQFLKSDFLKQVIDLTNNLVTTLNKIDPKQLAAFVTIGGFIGKSVVLNIVSNFEKNQKKIGDAFQKPFTEKSKDIKKTFQEIVDDAKQKISTVKIERKQKKTESNIKEKQEEIDKTREKVNKIQEEQKEFEKWHEQTLKDQYAIEIQRNNLLTDNLETQTEIIDITENSYENTAQAYNEELRAQQALLESQEKELKQEEEKLDTLNKEIDALKEKKQVEDKNVSKNLASNEEEKMEASALSTAGGILKDNLKDAAVAGLMAAVTTGFTTKNGEKAWEAAKTTFGAVMLPAVTQVIELGIKAALGTTAGLAVAAIAAVIGAAFLSVKIDEWGDKLVDPIDQATEQLKKEEEKLSKDSEIAQKSSAFAEQTKSNAESLEELSENYEKLNNKQFKTTAEQEEFNSLIEKLKESYSDLIAYENERTGEIRIQKELLEDQVKTAKELAKNAEKKALLDAKVVNNDIYATEMSQIEIDAEQAKKDLEDDLALSFADEAQGKIKGSNYTSAELASIFDYLDNEIDITELRSYGITLDPATIEKRYRDIYSNIVERREQAINEIEDEAVEKREKAMDDYIEAQRKTYVDYAVNLYDIDSDVATAISRRALTSEEKIISKENQKILDDFAKDVKHIKEDKISEHISLANDKSYNQILATIFGVDTTQEDWKSTLKETMKSSDMTVGEVGYYVNSMLRLSEITDQIDNFWNEIEEETYDKYLTLKEKISKGDISYKNLLGLSDKELTGNEVLDDALINQIGEERNKIYSILTDTSNKISVAELLFKAEKDERGFLTFDSSAFNDITVSTAEGLKRVQQNIIDSLGEDASSEVIKSVFDSFTNAISNIGKTEDIPKIMSLFDFENINATNFNEASISIQKSLEEMDYEAEQAEQIINNVFTFAEENDIYKPYLDSAGKLSEYMDSLPDKFKAINKAANDIATLRGVADSKGWSNATSDQIDKIKELGDAVGINTDKYIKFNESTKQYSVNAKKLYNDVDKLLNQQLKFIDDSIAYTKAEIEKAEAENEDTTELKEHFKTLQDNRKEVKKLVDESESELNIIKAIKTAYDTLTSSISTLTSAYKSINDEILETGHISSESFESLDDTLTTINEKLGAFVKETKNANDFIIEENGALRLNNNALYDYIDKLITSAETQEVFGESIDKNILRKLQLLRIELQETKKETEKANKEAWDTYNENVKSKYEEWQEALDKIKEKEEAVAEAEEKVREAEEKLLEIEEKLQEIYYGEKYHKNKNDYLYNYNVGLEQLEERISKAKDALDNMQPGDNAREKVQEYVDALREEITAYKAQNEVIKQYIENQKQMLDSRLSERLEQLKAEGAVDTSTNVSDFYYEKNGRFYIDYQKLNAAKLPDDISDFIEEQVENMNNYAKAYEDNLDKISDAEKEFRERQKKARDEYLNTENKVVELLKKKDQEELDSLKDKYDGMKEADDEYTDALEKSIKKQKDLRNQANQWDDLAEKEKKLSLQQRDTSGANAKEIKKAQEDIAKTRESLLDNAVDNIINNLKELYAEQEETRQAEIEYRQAILDNKNYVDEATAIINNWSSVEEAKAWFMQFDEEFINASDATIDKLLEDYEGYYNNTVMYNEWMSRSYEEVTNQTAEEIQEKIRETSETLTTETDRALDEIMEDVHEAQEQGRKDVEEAKKAVSDAKDAVVKATEEIAKALEEARKKQEEYNAAIAAQPAPGGKGGYDFDEDEDVYNENTKKESLIKLLNDFHYTDENNQNTMSIEKMLYNFGFITRDELIQFLYEHGIHGAYKDGEMLFANNSKTAEQKAKIIWRDQYHYFATGGLVDYTGPAWVDGTPSNPEAFLSATDTRLIREFIDLATLQLNPSEYQNNITSNHTIGDQAFNININVESISSDYDVDQMIERMHEDILSITNEPGSSVMLHK